MSTTSCAWRPSSTTERRPSTNSSPRSGHNVAEERTTRVDKQRMTCSRNVSEFMIDDILPHSILQPGATSLSGRTDPSPEQCRRRLRSLDLGGEGLSGRSACNGIRHQAGVDGVVREGEEVVRERPIRILDLLKSLAPTGATFDRGSWIGNRSLSRAPGSPRRRALRGRSPGLVPSPRTFAQEVDCEVSNAIRLIRISPGPSRHGKAGARIS